MNDQLRRLMALVGMAARIRASALNADDAALVVDAKSARAVSVRGKDGEIVLWIEPANGAGLFLRKQDSTVFRADQTIGVIGALPDKLPLRPGGDDSWNPGDGDLLFGSGLREGSALRDGGPANKS